MGFSLPPEQGALFKSLREGFARVAAQARHVRIRYDRIEDYARSLPDQSPFATLEGQHHFIGDREQTAAYVLALDAINFGSGYKPYMAAEGWPLIEGSTYYTIATGLKERFETGGVTARTLAAMTAGDVAAFLHLPPAGPYSREFSELCAESLQALGRLVESKYDGSFLKLVESTHHASENLVRILMDLPSFQDVHDYHGQPVAFLKRAQIAAADLQLAFRAHGQEFFSDIAGLTIFADNKVPHVLHTDGILEYTEDLAGRIAAGQDIASGSEEEVEIRACAAHAAELIAAAKNMRVMDVDHALWHRGSEGAAYRKKPSHRTLSWFY